MKKMKKYLLGLIMVSMASQMMVAAAQAAASPAEATQIITAVEEASTVNLLSADTAVAAATTKTGTIQATVNLRAKASTSSSVIRKLSKGETVTITSQPNSYWYKVKDSKGNVGYISTSSKYVKVSGQASSGGSSNSGTNGSTSSGSSSSSTTASAKVEKVISAGMKYLGTPYEYGSDRNSTKTFDCSDFVRRAFIEGANLTLPSDSRKQGAYVKANSTVKKSISSLKRGDLMFFGKYRGTSKSSYSSVNKDTETVTHVGIYLGDGKVLHTYSEKSGGVRVDTVTGKHWEYRFLFGGSAL